MAATRARSSIPRSQPPPPLPQLSSSAAAARPRLPLNVELWSFDGHICKAIGPDPIPVQYWVERLADELAGQGFTQTDHGITQGHFLRQLLKPPLSDTLITKIALLPAVDAAIKAGTATLHEHYALALVNCGSPEDALQIHYQATRPTRKSAEPLKAATVRAEQSWRAAAALGCAPSPAGCFYALFGLLTAVERQLFTSQAGIQARLVVPLGESPAAANDRHAALLTELLAWARVQSSTSPAGAGGPRANGGSNGGGGHGGGGGGGGGGGSGTGHGGRRRVGGRGGGGRRSSTPRAALAAAVTSSEAGSDSDDSDASPAPAATAAAAPAASAPSPRRRSPRIYCYTGDRAQDEVETNRRLRHGLCLKCLPNGAGASRAPFAFGSCPLHDQADSEYPRVNPYRA